MACSTQDCGLLAFRHGWTSLPPITMVTSVTEDGRAFISATAAVAWGVFGYVGAPGPSAVLRQPFCETIWVDVSPLQP